MIVSVGRGPAYAWYPLTVHAADVTRMSEWLVCSVCRPVRFFPQSAYRYVVFLLSATPTLHDRFVLNRREETRRTVQETERRRAAELERRSKEEKVMNNCTCVS